ncbi:MAG TPA: sigma-70 family RNA polymerase sigma factor [Candidatus Acidoferrales bacterium]|jgi:RNA polymerase sigma factor (sigma-70 family)|nr:sigma-70 family RNA polymerase sigma factor [Candidatus Acidoferrales bacterium]
MPDTPDMELVQEFARSGSETAFGEIVRRHLNLVHSVALRCTGHDGDAQDVTQAVFILLARKAGGLSAKTVLPGWLYETTRYTASRLHRTNIRRHAREQEAYMQSTLNDGASGNDASAKAWAQLAPHLEAAMSGLTESDRALLVLRFYQNQTAAKAAAQLGIGEDAAHKRLARALEKLRTLFTQRGITLSAATIAAAVSAHSVSAAPAGMAAKITSAGVVAAVLAHGTGWISVATLQKAAVGLLLAAAVGWLSYQTHETISLRDQIQTLKQGQAPLLVTIQQLQRERDAATSRAESLKDDLVKINIDNHELIRLRGEVGVLRQTQLTQPVPAPQTAVVHYDVITRHETTVIGMVNLDDYKAVTLEFNDWFPGGRSSTRSRAFLHEGQSFDDDQVKDAYVKIEIIKIEFAKGLIHARENGASVTYRFETKQNSDANLEAVTLRLHDSSLKGVFDLYSILSDGSHTLLIHPDARKKMPVDIAANPQSKAEAIQFLVGWLNDQGITIVPDGNDLEQIVPGALVKNVHPGATALPAPKPGEDLQSGFISFENADFEHVRDIYAALIGRKIIQNGPVSATISLQTRNSLSRAEVIYAFDVLLGWQGVKIVPVDSKTSKVVRFNATAQR